MILRLTALLRRGSEIQRRASAAALGLAPTPVELGALVAALTDDAPTVRRAAVDALGHLADETAAGPLLAALATDDQPGTVRARAAAALGNLGAHKAIKSLLQAFEQDTDPVRLRCAEALGRLRAKAAVPALASAARSDANKAIRETAVEALADIGNPAEAALVALAGDLVPPERLGVIRALGRTGGEAGIACLTQIVATRDYDELFAAVQALASINNPLSIEPLSRALGTIYANVIFHGERTIPDLAMEGLSRYDDRRAIETILHQFSFSLTGHAPARRALDAVSHRQPDLSWLHR